MRVVIDANTILSGLFFRGNERKLLLESLRGAVTLLYPEDVVDEVYEVVEREFLGVSEVIPAVELLETVLAAGELVRRESYAAEVPRWTQQLRDRSDAPLFACAVVVKADGIVSGDRDVLEARQEDIGVFRTTELLRRLVTSSD